MDLLSGVVRNRKMAPTVGTTAREIAMSFDGSEIGDGALTTWGRIWMYLSGSAMLRNFNLRVHKFIFQWDLVVHLAICIISLAPFMLTGSRLYSVVPISVWAFYNILFLIGTRRASLVIPNFGRLKHSFKALVEEFFSPKLLPVLSISFLLVGLSLSVTGRRLGGPPLCYSTCKKCLALWENAIPIDLLAPLPSEPDRASCGYANGRELMGYYTMAQTSFLLFLTVIIAMAVCMAWKVADDELAEREAAEEWLKREDPLAFLLRDELIKKFGPPASPIRPEGNAVWVAFGIVAALSFTLLGWHNWYVLPPSPTATMLIVLNLLTILMSSLILHLGFFGRLLSLYKRNYLRVQYLTLRLEEMGEGQVDTWWNCRSFVLNDDLALDYDIGGLAVSAAFVINLLVFVVLVGYTWSDGFGTMMEPPGSYCAYACMYITMCLIKIFTLATNTFEEQHRHVTGLQNLSINLLHRGGGGGLISSSSTASLDKAWSTDPSDAAVLGLGSAHSYMALQGLGLAGTPTAASVDARDGHDGPFNMDSGDSGDEAAGTPRSSTKSARGGGGVIGGGGSSGGGGGVGGVLGAATGGGGVGADPSMASVPSLRRMMLQALGLGLPGASSSSSSGVGGSGGSGGEGSSHGAGGASGVIDVGDGLGLAEAGGGVSGGGGGSGGVGVGGGIGGSVGAPTSSSRDAWDREEGKGLSSHSSCQPPLQLGLGGKSYTQPALNRSMSSVIGNLESRRQTLAEMVSQVRKYDPYPCILGIPVMPALFATSKFYIFLCFMLIGSRIFVEVLRLLF